MTSRHDARQDGAGESDFGAALGEDAPAGKGSRFRAREERGTRYGGSLDAGADLRLGLPQEWYAEGGMLDTTRFVSRWINDEGIRLHQMTTQDGWDFVARDGQAGLMDVELARAESTLVTQPVGTDATGRPIVAFLCRKPRAEWQEKQDRVVADRMAMQQRALSAKSPQALAEVAGVQLPASGRQDTFYRP